MKKGISSSKVGLLKFFLLKVAFWYKCDLFRFYKGFEIRLISQFKNATFSAIKRDLCYAIFRAERLRMER